MLTPSQDKNTSLEQKVSLLCETLAMEVSNALHKNERVVVLGGDHSSAIGTWSGVYDVLHTEGDLGLIWVDAHMDSHTPNTSESGRIHGMPLASLLGYGYPSLATILHAAPKLKPENVCLIGVRCFEAGEAAFLEQLNVKIYFMEEIRKRGFAAIWEEAKAYVSRHTAGYGISIDLDAIDPKEAPGVDVQEPDGILAADIYQALSSTISDSHLLLTEIVEFNPSRDYDHLTERLIISFIEQIAKGGA